MLSFLRLIRFPNLLMVALTMVLTKYGLINSFIKNTYLSHSEFVLLVFSVLLITSGGYIINDVLDVKTDKINKPRKVFVGDKISESLALRFYMFLSVCGLLISTYLSFTKDLLYNFIFFFIAFVGLFLYSKYLKKRLLFGNFLIAFLCSLIIILVVNFDFRVDKTNVPEVIKNFKSVRYLQFGKLIIHAYIFFAFLTTLIREIIKDIEDIDGDYAINAKTLPIVIGRKRTNRVVVGLTMLLILFLAIILKEVAINSPLFLGYGILFLIFPILYFFYKLIKAKTKKDYHFLSTLMKLIMLLGILSMLLFKFI